MKKWLSTGLLAVATSAILATTALAQEHKWRIQGYLPDSFAINADFREFAEVLKKKSNGAIEIQFLPVGAVVGVTETIDAMRNGVLSGHFTGISYAAAKDAAFSLAGDTLAAYDTAENMARWWSEGGGKEILRKLYDRQGAYIVGVLQSPSEVIPSTKPLNKVDDFKGLKIRSVQGTVADLFTKLGAGVVVLPGTEVFNALQTRLIDASDWGWYDLNEKTGLYQVAKYSIDARHSMGLQEFSLSKRVWDRPSEDQKSLVETEWNAFAQRMTKKFLDGEEAAKERIRKAGVTIIEFPAEERAKLRSMTYEIWDTLAAKSPAAKEVAESHKAFIQKLGIK